MAREVFGDWLVICDSTTDWLGDIHGCVRSVFGEIIDAKSVVLEDGFLQ